MKGILLGEEAYHFTRIFVNGRWERLKELIDIEDVVYSRKLIHQQADCVKTAEVAFATWNCPILSKEEIQEYLPNLKVLFYAAASVIYFQDAYLQCGIKIVSAASAMAVSVAEFTVGEIYHANKGVYGYMRNYSSIGHATAHENAQQYPGNYKTRVGILGVGMIGTRVINMLKAFSELEIMVYDPYLEDQRVKALSVSRNSLEEIFSQCQTISNHMADNKDTKNLLNGSLFSLMKDNAAFINTGRGAQVNHDDLYAALREKPGRTAILDVTYPEPLPSNHALLGLDNVFITPHIAGTAANDILRMTDFLLGQLVNYKRDLPLLV